MMRRTQHGDPPTRGSRVALLGTAILLSACGAIASQSRPTGIIPRPGLTGNCILTGNSGWIGSEASGKVVVFGKAVTETGSCGYTIGGTVTGIPMSVTIEAQCRYVGYLVDAGAGSCNDLGDTIGNRILARDLLAQGTTETRTWYAWGIKSGQPTIARAVREFTHRPGDLGRNEFRDFVSVAYPRGANLADAAVGTATLEGAKIGPVFGLSGPTSVDVTQAQQWSVTAAGGYAPDLFRYRWAWNGQSLGTTPTNTFASGVPSGPGPHTLSAVVTLDDGYEYTVQQTVMPKLHPSVNGPSTIVSPAYYTWAVDDAAAVSSQVTYGWTQTDVGSGQTTFLGTGASVTLLVDQYSPSMLRLDVTVSASGYLSASMGVEIANQMSGGCGAQACLRADTSHAPVRRGPARRSR